MDLVNYFDCYSMVPDEIFIHIFILLPLDDRKSIRLTCRRFYELCDDSLIQSTEVIALRGNFNTVPALHCLSKSSTRIQNIKLCRMRLNTEAVLPFFEQHGPHVRSLDLKECTFGQGVVKVMIEHCTHLRHFAVKFIPSEYVTVLNDFEDLLKNSIVRDCVTDFSLILRPIADSITNGKILYIFAIFPKIIKLNLDISVGTHGLHQNAFNMCTMKLSDESREASFLSHCILDCLLAMADQLEVLNLYFDGRMPNSIFNIRMKNLKQLSFSWFYDLPDIPSLYHSSLFERLTHFTCSIHYGRERDPTSLVVQRLLQFTPLQSLTITDCEVLDRKLFEAFVKSKLKTLVIRRISYPGGLLSLRDLKITEHSSSENSLMPNYCLQHLLIVSGGRDLSLIFASYFRSVNHLTFSELYDGAIQNIIKDQTNIRSLHLGNFTASEVFKELSYFQDWLQMEKTINRELRYLTELRIREEKYSLTCFLLNEFVLPKLKRLTITLWKCDEHDVEQLYRLIPKFAQLKSLNLFLPCEMPHLQWLMVCKSLPELRHFLVRSTGTIFTLTEYNQLFNASPSLRKITHHSYPPGMAESQSKYFFHDIIGKTVIDSPS